MTTAELDTAELDTATRARTAPRAALYARRSTEDEKSGRSEGEQVTACKQVVAEQGWSLDEAHVYQDKGRSASRFATKTRDDWSRLLAELAVGGFDVLVLWESSRGDRRLTGWAALLDTCRERGVLVHIVTHRRTYDPRVSRDWRSLAEDGIDSAVESEKTSERVRRAVAALAVEGTPTGRIPYGYQRRYDPITRKLVKQEPDPDEAPIVREIIGRVARGDAVSVITADLNARGVRASEGGQWTRGMVRKVAGSPTYVARRVHRGQVYDGKWPALVSETEWAAARRVLGDRARTTTRPGRARWLLSYLAQCSVCETRLQTHPACSGRHACYACPHGHTTVNMDALDAVVIDAVVTRLADPAEVAELMAADDAAAVAAGEEAVALRARLADHYDEAADGKLSAAGLAAVEARLLTRIEDADQRAQVAAVPMQLRELVAVGDDRKDAVLDRWTALPLSSQRGILRELFARLAVAPLGRVGRRGDSDPEVVESRVSFESSEETPRWRQPGRSSAPFFA